MRLIESFKKKKLILFNIFLTLYVGINLIGGERGLVSYFEKKKIHEELISKGDSFNSLEAKDHYLILNNRSKFQKYQKSYKNVPLNFCYSSDNNKSFLSVNQLKDLIKSQMINFNI